MTPPRPSTADRVQSFIAAVDIYTPQKLAAHTEAFRAFARAISRRIDGRYLERHPVEQLLPDLESLMQAGLCRQHDEVLVKLQIDSKNPSRGVLYSCMPDQLFIFSTVRLAVESLELEAHRHINGIASVRRSSKGEIEAVSPTELQPECFIWLEVEAADLEERRVEIENYVRGRLEAASKQVEDFPAMSACVEKLVGVFERLAHERPDHRAAHEENASFLRWLLNNHFVFLGTKHVPNDSGRSCSYGKDLGSGRFADWRGMEIEEAERDILAAGEIAPFLWVRKSRGECWTYRRGRTDRIIVVAFNEEGHATGLLVIDGVFSFEALQEPKTNIPILSRIIAQIFAELQVEKGSHRYRAVRNAFNSLPLEYLFILSPEDIRNVIQQILDTDADQRLHVHLTTDSTQNFAFVFVALPRSRFSDELRREIRTYLRSTFHASAVDDGVYAADTASVTLHFFLTGASFPDTATPKTLHTEIEQMASSWNDRLRMTLEETFDPEAGRRLFHHYQQAFPESYKENTSVARAVKDIRILENLSSSESFDCEVYAEPDDVRTNTVRLRFYETKNLLLSDMLPILDNLGMVVRDQFTSPVHALERADRYIVTFRIGGVQDLEEVNLLQRRNRLRAAIRAVVSGAMENEALNRLLLRADIPWTFVCLIRAFHHYARQIRAPYANDTVRGILLRHGDTVRALTELFRVKFDPGLQGASASEVDDYRRELIERARKTIAQHLEKIDDLTSHQVLLLFLQLIEATVRTNFYKHDLKTTPRISLKFDPSKIERIPMPRPFREIFVFHPQVMGTHLRGAAVARGGLRWSDRLADFRTEILDLMATQNLKNVLIVPRGAKGGFVLRTPVADPKERRTQADEQYKTFIRGLLDVTDNMQGDEVIRPTQVLAYDENDPYLVVAADKGTAHLSDTANAIAEENGFWLQDAFASGGSEGYDHKVDGITARGAWECVKRHFLEMGMNPETDPVRVVGIGDMSGDVFGNGLLRSKSIRLVAAFDHRHIFVDPNPDPLRSWEERKRLFELSGSSWEDYNREAMSPGAGIFPRGAKSIELSDEARACLEITDEVVSGVELVQAILRMPVGLIWNGGIGTYIRADRETNLDVGDPANDAVRVHASSVRAKVVGEGGNLGITPWGRVALGSRGVRLNTDAVDNSAGVDLSDHEVNLKILFSRGLREGSMTRAERNEWLEKIRQEVGLMTLRNNWVQSRMLSLDRIRSKHDLPRFARAIAFLTEHVPLDRRALYLPGERYLQQRRQAGRALHRAELAIIGANAKIYLRQQLGHSSLGHETLQEFLFEYFPDSLHKEFREHILEHPLATQIAQTQLCNNIIGDAGAAWLPEVVLRSGRSVDEIVRSYLTASRWLNASEIKTSLDAQELEMRTQSNYRLRLILEDSLMDLGLWLLRRTSAENQGIDALFTSAFEAVATSQEAQSGSTVRQQRNSFSEMGASDQLATSLSQLAVVREVADVALLSYNADMPVARAASAYYAIGAPTGLLDVLRRPAAINGNETLLQPAWQTVHDQLRNTLVELVGELMKAGDATNRPSRTIQDCVDGVRADLSHLQGERVDLPSLVLAVDRIRRRVRSFR